MGMLLLVQKQKILSLLDNGALDKEQIIKKEYYLKKK